MMAIAILMAGLSGLVTGWLLTAIRAEKMQAEWRRKCEEWRQICALEAKNADAAIAAARAGLGLRKRDKTGGNAA